MRRRIVLVVVGAVVLVGCDFRGPEWRFGDTRPEPGLISGWFESRAECEAATAQYKREGGSPTECIPVGHGVGNMPGLPYGRQQRAR